MCGIAGLVSNNEVRADDIIASMLAAIEHRGRDGHGILQCNSRVVFGHTRLSIIDTTNAGAQPFVYKSLSLTFNGEIYNYLELKQMLLREKVTFETMSDTEVLIKLIYYKGIDSLSLVEGMFALALFDSVDNKVYLARDYFGEKPLFYSVLDDGTVLFSSEIKAIFSTGLIEKKLCSTAINQFLTLLYTHGETTFYNNIKSCLPNTLVTIDLSSFNTLTVKTIKTNEPNVNYGSNWRETIVDSVSKQLRADVPTGLWLSGGVDSSVIAAVAREELGLKLQTFTIGFHNSKFLDEKNHANQIANLFKHENTTLNLDSRFSEAELNELIHHMDNPVANASILLYNRLSIESRKYIKVALSGVGGDELFAGYNRYRAFNLHTYLRLLSLLGVRVPLKYLSRVVGTSRMNPIGNSLRAINKMLSSIDSDKSKFYYNLIDYSQGEIENYDFRKIESIQDALDNDLSTYLNGDLLYLGDLFSMKNNLETRSPFLNVKLSKQLTTLTTLGTPGKKELLRNYLDELSNKRYKAMPKRGFSMPVEPFLIEKGRNELHNIFTKADIQGLVGSKYYFQTLNGFFDKNQDYSNQLFSFYILATKRLHENI